MLDMNGESYIRRWVSDLVFGRGSQTPAAAAVHE